MSYHEALRRLEVYEPKELGRGHICDDSGLRCAVGALFGTTWRLDVALGAAFLESIEETRIICANDSFVGTPAERYEYMVRWLRERVAEEK